MCCKALGLKTDLKGSATFGARLLKVVALFTCNLQYLLNLFSSPNVKKNKHILTSKCSVMPTNAKGSNKL